MSALTTVKQRKETDLKTTHAYALCRLEYSSIRIDLKVKTSSIANHALNLFITYFTAGKADTVCESYSMWDLP